jgi:hypothetical protein
MQAGNARGSPLLQRLHVFVSVTALGTAQKSIFLQRYQVLALHLIHIGLDSLVHVVTAAAAAAMAAMAAAAWPWVLLQLIHGHI